MVGRACTRRANREDRGVHVILQTARQPKKPDEFCSHNDRPRYDGNQDEHTYHRRTFCLTNIELAIRRTHA